MPQPIRAGLLTGPSASRTLWLQLLACALAAFAWFRGDALVPDVEPDATADAAASGPAHRRVAQAGAAIGPASIEVIVGRNDTLDRIFRRLELSLADLASLRSLPSVRAQLD
ncbi:MAG: hypothetical protein WCE48_10520, partial [Steroidobacteraceae bacterium]